MRERATSILPRDKAAARLDFVIAVMAFLAALALGASLLATRAADGWQSGLSDRLTIQVMPPESGDPQAGLAAESAAALAVLDTTPGVAHANLLSQAQIDALVEPWIGKDGAVSGIALPQLIDAAVIPGEEVDVNRLGARLKQVAPHASVDDHRRWIARLRGEADAVRFCAYGILFLIAGATAAAVSFATRAGLDAHHDMVALLHQMGAMPSFIARAMAWHYFLSALLAAAVGTLFAALFFLAAGGLEVFGLGPVALLPPLSLEWTEFPWLLSVPAAVAMIAWATARISVLSVVKAIY